MLRPYSTSVVLFSGYSLAKPITGNYPVFKLRGGCSAVLKSYYFLCKICRTAGFAAWGKLGTNSTLRVFLVS